MPIDRELKANSTDSTKRGKKRKKLLWGACLALGLITLLIGMAWRTMIYMPGVSYHGKLPPADEQLEALASELRGDVDALAVKIGERNVRKHPRQLAQAANYIESAFKAAGYIVERQEYLVSETRCCNLEVEIPGSVRPKEIVIVGAHYDTASGTPGANDNASGVAATLALARKFSHSKTGRTLRFVAFVNEEPPYFQTDKMGSRVYAQRCRERHENVVAMLSLETLGCYSDTPGSQKYPPPFSFLYPSEGNFIGFIGNTASRGLVRQMVETFRHSEQFPSEGAAAPAMIRKIGFSDHWSFWQEGYSALMVTDTAMCRYPHYHELTDTIDKIDFDRMARVVRGLNEVVRVLVNVDTNN